MRKGHRFAPIRYLRTGAVCGFIAIAGCGGSTMKDPPPGPAPSDAGAQADAAPVIPCTVTAPTACPDPAPRYPDVEPIFQQRCVVCHSDHSARWPLTTFNHVADWADQIHDDMLTCAMPPPQAGIPITTEERIAILTWIRCGFPQ